MPGFLVAIITTIHVLSCVALTVSILLQSGKGGGLAGAFGGGSSQTLFGGRGAATFLSRASTALAVVFFVTSLTLGLAQTRGAGRASLIQEEARRRASQRSGTTGQPAPMQQSPGQQPGSALPAGPSAPPSGGTPAPATGPVAPPTQTPAPTPSTGGGK